MALSALAEKSIRALVEAGPDALVVCDAEGRIVFVNREAERLYGYPDDELVGQRIELLMPERHREAHEVHRARYVVEPRARPMGSGRRFVSRRRDGTEFPAEISLSPVPTEHGTFVAAAVRDVTEQRRLEQALADAEAQMRELVEHAPDGIFVADRSGRLTDANAAGCRMLGYTRAEVVGMDVTDLFSAEDVPRVEPGRERVDEPGASLFLECHLRRKDGSLLPAEVSAKILTGGRSQAIVRDVSERRRLEREHAAATERLRMVLEQCPVGIVIMTRRGEHLDIEINDRGKALIQRPTQEIRLGQYAPFFSYADGSPVLPDSSPAARALRGERLEPVDLLLTRPDGSRIPIQMRGAPLFGPDGAVEGSVLAFEDVTAEKDLERLRTEWNAIVAHDLRNPLNVILLHARLLSRAADEYGELTESITEILSAGRRMERMIHDLLDVSRLEAHQLSLQREPTSLAGAVQRAVDRAALAAPDRAFVIRAAVDAPPVLADGDRIAQVLDNLLSNAVKYGAPSTPVVVSIEPEPGAVAVAVTNEGTGLTRDAAEQLFRRFHRAADQKLASVKGIGLGLYIARELVEAHGGNITVESTPDRTTTFRFTLPAA